MATIRVLVVGAAGRMGREVVRAVCAEKSMELVGAVDQVCAGQDAVGLAGAQAPPVLITDSLADAIAQASPEVVVDFTVPDAVMANARTAVKAGVATVVGATGMTEENLRELARLCEERRTPALVAPNFAIGAVLMMQFATQAARHFDSAEIIELHHADKRDAPSGTALRTAQLMAGASGSKLAGVESSDGRTARGQAEGAIHIHSVRLPGLVAHQEVILGGLGQTLTIRHDSTSHQSFMPGVLLAIRKVRGLRGLVVGLEKIL
ncbi:MAG: 4-hydroxy-tetrahydrodipicolinate reductase [Armatimonadota bacterium]|nr:MAG: 4-hydroxy-tetrahydrodipicolinate reductase [Armatimonadota bacterium]